MIFVGAAIIAEKEPLRSDTTAANASAVIAADTHRDEAALANMAERFGFSKREAEIASYLVKGRSAPYIAEALFVTTGTVKTHIKHIYRKCEVNSRQEIIDLYESMPKEP